jgi:trehalose/maltose hydrolase-like predicted phosphorylase
VDKRLWSISEFPFEPAKQLYYETIFSIGNGYLGCRAAFEEGYAGDTPATLIHGIYNHAPGTLVPELVNAPNWLDIRLWIDGTPFELITTTSDYLKPPEGVVLGYRRTLHLDHGLLRRAVLFRAASGAVVRLVFDRFASLHDVHVLAQRVEITAVDGNPEIIIESALDGNVTNKGVRHWHEMTPGIEGDTISLHATTAQSGYRLGMASCLDCLHPVQADSAGLRPYTRSHARLAQEESVCFDKLTAIYTSRDTDTPLPTAQAKASAAAQAGYDALLSRHIAEWETYWDETGIEIEGDDEAQLALRFTTYHLLIPAPRHDDNVSVGAKTLSGFGYKGHVFWDTELFILPPITLTQPQIARNLLMYRYHRLEGARNKARINGYEGAMFPWESTDTGEETTPKWSDPQPDGSRIRIWTGDNEQHISTDISYAILQYWRWTGDDDFLRRCGAEIVLDTAVFWGSRVEERNGRFELTRQIGPDEYHENIDNSVFTNRMVVWHLQQALRLLDWLRHHAPADADRLIAQLDLNASRLARWQDIIERMYIPFDAEKRIHVQFDGFFDMEYIPVPYYEPRTASVQAILGHARSIQSQVIKQADVVMLMALVGEELAPHDVLLNNWHTYYPRTDHGSSLSPAVHVWVAARLGLDDDAYHMFMHAAGIDLNDNKGNVGDGIHGAACGGLWQAVVFGFCGLHLAEDGPALRPRLPAHWWRVTFQVRYRGQKHRLTVKNPVLDAPPA